MDQYQAFNPDSTSGFGDYYDPRSDPRLPTSIAKYGGRVNYCAAPPHKPAYQRGLPQSHSPDCGCSVCVGFTQRTWDTTNDYDYQYQDGTNFRHGTQCVGPHRGVHDTRVPRLRPAWGTEQMTSGTAESVPSPVSTPVSTPLVDTNMQYFWLFVMIIIVTCIVNLACVIQLRALSHEIHEAKSPRIF